MKFKNPAEKDALIVMTNILVRKNHRVAPKNFSEIVTEISAFFAKIEPVYDPNKKHFFCKNLKISLFQ